MKASLLITTVLVGAGFALTQPAWAAESIASKTKSTATRAMTEETVREPALAAQRFVEHVNYARVALAMKDNALAQSHIGQARNMLAVVKAANADQRRVQRLETGRVTYDYKTSNKYYYYPFGSGPVQVKTLKSGPFWAKKGIAVTDAEVVYLSLDLSDDDAAEYLNKAEAAIQKGDISEADEQLADLTDDVVEVDDTVVTPSVKARDNIALARYFVAARNYDGARYALRHADDALDAMEGDDRYQADRAAITAMRKDVNALEASVEKNDPTLLDKADKKLEKWWTDLKQWADRHDPRDNNTTAPAR